MTRKVLSIAVAAVVALGGCSEKSDDVTEKALLGAFKGRLDAPLRHEADVSGQAYDVYGNGGDFSIYRAHFDVDATLDDLMSPDEGDTDVDVQSETHITWLRSCDQAACFDIARKRYEPNLMLEWIGDERRTNGEWRMLDEVLTRLTAGR